MVDRLAGLYHQHHPARLFQDSNQFLNRVRAHDLCAGRFLLDEIVYFGDGSIKHTHAITVVVHIQDQILAHDSQADQSDVAAFLFHSISWLTLLLPRPRSRRFH